MPIRRHEHTQRVLSESNLGGMNTKKAVFRGIVAVFFLFGIAQSTRILIPYSICNSLGGFGTDIPSNILSFFSGVFLFLGGCVLWKYGHIVPFILFLSGGLSNLFERWQFGCITDYIRVFEWFPIFNLADVYLTVAGVCVIVLATRSKEPLVEK